jgi:hypothetical protein
MSAIFDNASQVTQGNKLSVMSATTLSGKRVSQRRGPFLYTFDVVLNPLSTDSTAYKTIRSEIAALDYGVTALTTTIPYLTAKNGSWATDSSVTVDGADQTGRTVTLGGFTANQTDVIIDGDFLQFANNTKVYQAIGDYDSDASGNVDVYLNSPLVTSPADGSDVVIGEAVEFSLYIEDSNFQMSHTPRSTDSNIVKVDSISLTELIT